MKWVLIQDQSRHVTSLHILTHASSQQAVNLNRQHKTCPPRSIQNIHSIARQSARRTVAGSSEAKTIMQQDHSYQPTTARLPRGRHETRQDIPQLSSSDPSLQSEKPSHLALSRTHAPLAQLNWSRPHAEGESGSKIWCTHDLSSPSTPRLKLPTRIPSQGVAGVLIKWPVLNHLERKYEIYCSWLWDSIWQPHVNLLWSKCYHKTFQPNYSKSVGLVHKMRTI